MTDIHLDRPVDVSNGDEEESFDTKYLKFRSDPDKMQEMNEFVNNLIADAEQQADTQLEAKKLEEQKRLNSRSLFTGLRKGRMLTRARTVVIRMFEAICNCTTSTSSPSVATQEQHQRPMLQKSHTLAN